MGSHAGAWEPYEKQQAGGELWVAGCEDNEEENGQPATNDPRLTTGIRHFLISFADL
jgi:hypothetical protein